jgi:hypothetical protein
MANLKIERNAGGMSYRTLSKLETILINQYLDNKNPSKIFEKNKIYYLTSADKTIARLKLAKIRVDNSDMSHGRRQKVLYRINHGLDSMEYIKERVKNSTDNRELLFETPYKLWHKVKLIPSAAEGCAILSSLENTISSQIPKNQNKDVNIDLKNTKKIFSYLLNLDESSDFELAEKCLFQAYKELEVFRANIISK